MLHFVKILVIEFLGIFDFGYYTMRLYYKNLRKNDEKICTKLVCYARIC